ncbi:MAG: hypothetical protein AAGK69_10905 [Pseudomonadota bacterium]
MQWLIPGVPVLSLPVALWLGFRRTMWIVMAIAALIVIVPHAYFGVWALWAGVSLHDVFEALSGTWRAFPVILAYMVLWSVVFAAAGGVLRYGWIRWRAA